MNDKVWLIIPAYNVEPYLDVLLSQSGCFIPANRTVVIDDGSSDQTEYIARNRGVYVISHESNIGKGKSLRDGIEYAEKNGAEWVIMMDGDCQHDPVKIPEFIKASESGRFDLLIGNRRREGSKMPWDRRLSNGLTSLLISIITRQKIFDVQCGFRMIRLKALKGLEFRTKRYEFETEILLKMTRRGARIGWIAIPTRYYGEASSISRLTDTIRFVRLVFLYLIRFV